MNIRRSSLERKEEAKRGFFRIVTLARCRNLVHFSRTGTPIHYLYISISTFPSVFIELLLELFPLKELYLVCEMKKPSRTLENQLYTAKVKILHPLSRVPSIALTISANLVFLHS